MRNGRRFMLSVVLFVLIDLQRGDEVCDLLGQETLDDLSSEDGK